MDDNAECTFTNFVGNTELGGVVNRPEKEPPYRANLVGREAGPTRFAQGLTKIHVKSCIWVGRIPHSSTGWGLTG